MAQVVEKWQRSAQFVWDRYKKTKISICGDAHIRPMTLVLAHMWSIAPCVELEMKLPRKARLTNRLSATPFLKMCFQFVVHVYQWSMASSSPFMTVEWDPGTTRTLINMVGNVWGVALTLRWRVYAFPKNDQFVMNTEQGAFLSIWLHILDTGAALSQTLEMFHCSMKLAS